MTTDDPEWDAAAADRFNATFDRRAAEVDLIATFRRLLAEHGEPIVLDLPPDLDPTLRDALIDEGRTNPSVIVVDHRGLGPLLDRVAHPMHHALDLHAALGRMEAAVAHIPKDPPMFAAIPALLAAASLSTGVPPMPGERDLFRVPAKAPKPPEPVQAAIMDKAARRRERVRLRNLAAVANGGAR